MPKTVAMSGEVGGASIAMNRLCSFCQWLWQRGEAFGATGDEGVVIGAVVDAACVAGGCVINVNRVSKT